MRSAADAVRPERAGAVMMYSTPRHDRHLAGPLRRESRTAGSPSRWAIIPRALAIQCGGLLPDVVVDFAGDVVLAVLLMPGRLTWLAKPGAVEKIFQKVIILGQLFL